MIWKLMIGLQFWESISTDRIAFLFINIKSLQHFQVILHVCFQNDAGRPKWNCKTRVFGRSRCLFHRKWLLDPKYVYLLSVTWDNSVSTCGTVAVVFANMSRDMTKPTKWVCAQRRLRSAWVSAQSNLSSLCAQWVAKGPRFLHADSKDSDQTVRIPRLIWVFAGRTLTSFVLSKLFGWKMYLNTNCLLRTIKWLTVNFFQIVPSLPPSILFIDTEQACHYTWDDYSNGDEKLVNRY